MDGVYNGKPYFLMDDFGVKPTIFGNIHIFSILGSISILSFRSFGPQRKDRFGFLSFKWPLDS